MVTEIHSNQIPKPTKQHPWTKAQQPGRVGHEQRPQFDRTGSLRGMGHQTLSGGFGRMGSMLPRSLTPHRQPPCPAHTTL